MSAILAAALVYATEHGWPVFPIAAQAKRPLTAHGFRDASTDEAQIKDWWRRWPDANVAIPTGALTFDALDVDGEDGVQSLEQLVTRYGELPLGPVQVTGGGGRHIDFVGGTLPTSARRLPGIDTRGAGGYVVVAPSVHRSGRVYEWHGLDLPMPVPPPWLLEILSSAQPRLAPAGPQEPAQVDDETAACLLRMAGIPLVVLREGTRNDRLFRYGCSARGRGAEHADILRLLVLVNQHLCLPPIDQRELATIAGSAASKAVSEAYQRGRAAVERAVEAASREESERQVDEALASDGDLGRIRDAVEKAAGVRVERVIQIGKDTPTYLLDLGDGAPVHVGRSVAQASTLHEALLRHRQLVGFTGAGVSRKHWPAVLAGLMRLVVVREDDELSRMGETRVWLHLHRRAEEDETGAGRGAARTYEAVRARAPFEEAEQLHVNSAAFMRHVRAAGLGTPTLTETVARLKELGAEPIQIAESDPSGTARAVARYWRVGLGRI